MKEGLKTTLRRVWVVAIAVFVVVYVYAKADTFAALLSELEGTTLASAIGLIFVGKLALAAIMFVACRRFQIMLPAAEAFSIYNTTQLAKYIPGSIWQFVGRIAALKSRGADNRQIRNSMVYEHAWVVGFAGVVGTLLVLYRYDLFLEKAIEYGHDGIVLAVVAGAIVLTLAGLGVMIWKGLHKRVGTWLKVLAPTTTLIVLLLVAWGALGLSYSITMPASETMSDGTIVAAAPWFYVIGIFLLSYAVGFFVPFAPAGLGVREVVLAFGMSPYLDLDHAVFLASLNRVAYFATEVLLFLVVSIMRAPKTIGTSR